jgi:phosphate butyryltransferase
MKIGRNLQTVMTDREVSAEGLREALGWDRQTLASVLADQLAPSISELLRLATFLGVGISSLLYGKEQSGKRAIKTSKNERVGVDRRSTSMAVATRRPK